jgi:hypothetical protein
MINDYTRERLSLLRLVYYGMDKIKIYSYLAIYRSFGTDEKVN